MIHQLKILPEYFVEVFIKKTKLFEIRKDDRNIQIDDVVVLKEWDSCHGYTGRSGKVIVKYIMHSCHQHGLRKGYCIFCGEIEEVEK